MDKTAKAAYYTYYTLVNRARTGLMRPDVRSWESLTKAEQDLWRNVAEEVIQANQGLSISQLEQDY